MGDLAQRRQFATPTSAQAVQTPSMRLSPSTHSLHVATPDAAVHFLQPAGHATHAPVVVSRPKPALHSKHCRVVVPRGVPHLRQSVRPRSPHATHCSCEHGVGRS